MRVDNSIRAALTFGAAASSDILDTSTDASVKNVASTIAYGAMSYYTGNITNTPQTIAVLPEPYYWWEAGALWGAMLDYYHYTGDDSYQNTVIEALLSQVGPEYNYMNPIHYGSTGNDDQAFWGFAVLAAAERNLPQPRPDVPSWLQLGENLWNSMVVRWNNTHCGGGFTWQIFADNPNGLNYKNSVSNGGFFQLSARLARATGNSIYAEWATKVWDWSEAVGFISPAGNVFDGADARDNCTKINRLTFTYSHGIYMYGAAVMANVTGDPNWSYHVINMLDAAEKRFFSPYENATDIMYEQACETVGTCNVDMKSFKAYLSRFMWATSQIMPSVSEPIRRLLATSAKAAAKACTGGEDGTTCGQKWYVGGFDGVVGLGQQLCALEVVQGLLAKNTDPPYDASKIKDVRPRETTTPEPIPSKRSDDEGEGENADNEDAGTSIQANLAFLATAAGTAILALVL